MIWSPGTRFCFDSKGRFITLLDNREPAFRIAEPIVELMAQVQTESVLAYEAKVKDYVTHLVQVQRLRSKVFRFANDAPIPIEVARTLKVKRKRGNRKKRYLSGPLRKD